MARGVALEDTIRQQCVKTLHLTEVQKDVNLNRPVNPEREDELWSTCQIDTLAKWGEEPVILEIKTALLTQSSPSKSHKPRLLSCLTTSSRTLRPAEL